MKIIKQIAAVITIVSLIFLNSCEGIKFYSDAQARNERIKTQTENLIAAATDNYPNHEKEVQALKDSFQVAIVAEHKRGKTNFPTESMWKQLDGWMNKDFANTWKSAGKFGATAVDELKKRADKLFDYIITFEDSKIKPKN